MKIYPYNYPLILDDTNFAEFGGVTGSTTTSMRTAAYCIAEQQMTNYIDTFLLPTTITGTWNYSPGTAFISTDYGYVQELSQVRILDPHGNQLRILSGTHSNFASIRDDTYGYIYVNQCLDNFGYPLQQPYVFEYVYTAGLPSGVGSQYSMLMALAGAAQITLNELMVVPANETTGDAGVVEFTSLQYSEKRKPWKNTAFGASAKAAKIAQLVDSTIRKARKTVMLGR